MLKHRLSLYFRSITPVLAQAYSIGAKLQPQVAQLESTLAANREQSNTIKWLLDLANEAGLVQEQVSARFSLSMRHALQQAANRLNVFLESEDGEDDRGMFSHCIVSRSIFEMRKKLVNNLFGFSAAMSAEELETFENDVVSQFRDRVGARRASQSHTH